jgi:hypothetical protein
VSFQLNPQKRVIKAGLKHFPHDLGLLLLEAGDYGSPFDIALNGMYGISPKVPGWPMIEECLEQAVVGQEPGLKLQDLHSNTNLYPFMTAAHQSHNHVDLIYYLLRKDPSALLPRDSIHVETDKTTLVVEKGN